MTDDRPDIDLEALDEYLMSGASPQNCMMLSDLDGFLTGIVIGPELVPPSEWLPVVWGGEEPEFASVAQMQTVTGTIMGRYDAIALAMKADPDGFVPIFYDGPLGDTVISDWAAGFIDAMKLRRHAWEPMLKHRRAKILADPLVILGDEEDFFERHTPAIERRFYAARPDVIKTCVIGIYEFWQDWHSRQKPQPRRQRGGRR